MANSTPGMGTPTARPAATSDEWLKMAQDAYRKSTTYYDTNWQKQVENGLRMFNNQHPRNSKYNSEAYKYRSRLFRPKTRSTIRKHEATAMLAFFSNPSSISVDPENPTDQYQVQSSVVMKSLLDYRLNKTIPWFLLVLGGFQDAMTVGAVASFQYWKYQTRRAKRTVEVPVPELGISFPFEQEYEETIEDKPCVELVALDNIRFDPAAQWHDPLGTSPYVILQIPMYIRDVLDRMEDESYGWKKLDEATILNARITETSPTQQARDQNREDPYTLTSDVNEFDLVCVHLNFIHSGGDIYTFYSLKDQERLTEPELVTDVFQHCRRGEIPVTMGFCVLETHKSLKSGLTHLGEQLQIEANEVANQRIDNVKFVLNKRWFVRRGSQADVESLVRNVPGGVTMLTNPETDVREVNWQDVTSSAYAEQDRINVDFDELLGNFAQSSVLTNRRLNETVGGMRMMAQGANVITEYTIRVFSETWVQPTLQQLARMEQRYETDDVLMSLAADKAQFFQRFGVNPDWDRLLSQDLTITINVGMGATDPDTRFNRFIQAAGAYGKLALEGPPDLNLPEIRQELFGLAGFRDAARFFTQVDVQKFKQDNVAAQAQAEANKIVEQNKDRIQRRERQLDKRDSDLDLREAEHANEAALTELANNTQDRLRAIEGRADERSKRKSA